MALLCIAYVIGIGTILGVGGLLMERVLPAGAPRRWIWCVVITGTMTVPPIYRAINTTTVDGRTVHLHDAGAVASGATGFWSGVAAYDAWIGLAIQVASALMLAWFCLTAWRVHRVVRASRRAHASSERMVDGVPVVLTDAIGPATVGVFRPRVLLPAWVFALPQAQRRYVVRHEDEHRRANDARLLFVASLFLILVPWNLALWWQLRRLRLAVEMDCDRRVVRALGDRRSYAELLLRVAQAGSRTPQFQPALLGAGMLERRLRALVAPAGVTRAMRVAIPIIVLALLTAVLLIPHPVLGASTAAPSISTQAAR